MPTPKITELTHWDEVARRFRTIADLPWAAWLDSAAADSDERFDILVADPYVTLRTRGITTEIVTRAGAKSRSQRSPFELVREQLGDVTAPASGLPFAGGCVGYFGYDLKDRIEAVPDRSRDDLGTPVHELLAPLLERVVRDRLLNVDNQRVTLA